MQHILYVSGTAGLSAERPPASLHVNPCIHGYVSRHRWQVQHSPINHASTCGISDFFSP